MLNAHDDLFAVSIALCHFASVNSPSFRNVFGIFQGSSVHFLAFSLISLHLKMCIKHVTGNQTIISLCNLRLLTQHRVQTTSTQAWNLSAALPCVSLWSRIHTVQCRNVSQKQVFWSWTGFGIQQELGHNVHPNSGISRAGEQQHRLLLSLAGSGPAEHCG